MYVLSLCKLMKAREFFFSSHGIRARKRIGILGLGLAESSIPATRLVVVFLSGLINSIEAIRKPSSTSEPLTAIELLWRPCFQSTSTPLGSSATDLLIGGRTSDNHQSMHLHASGLFTTLSLTRQRVKARWPISRSSNFTCRLVRRRSFLLSF